MGGGRTARKCTVLRENREMKENMHIAVLSQGLLSRIVGKDIFPTQTAKDLGVTSDLNLSGKHLFPYLKPPLDTLSCLHKVISYI